MRVTREGYNMTEYSSAKGAAMIELQRDTRRQRHIEALKECEKFVEQFYDNFSERKSEMKERVEIFFSASDNDIKEIMDSLSDEQLLANDVTFVNSAWEKVVTHRNARKQELERLKDSI